MPNQPIITTVEYRGMRNFKKDAYHYCARCGSRVQIKEMIWQRGLLLCKKWDCVDYGNHGYPLIGQREAAIVTAIDIPNSHEMQPDDKLISPTDGGSNTDDEIYF